MLQNIVKDWRRDKRLIEIAAISPLYKSMLTHLYFVLVAHIIFLSAKCIIKTYLGPVEFPTETAGLPFRCFGRTGIT